MRVALAWPESLWTILGIFAMDGRPWRSLQRCPNDEVILTGVLMLDAALQ